MSEGSIDACDDIDNDDVDSKGGDKSINYNCQIAPALMRELS